MANAITLVGSVIVGAGGAASIDFTSIPQTGTDLMLLISGRTAATYVADQAYLKFNGSSTSYNNVQLYGNGSSVASTTSGSTYVVLYAIPGNTATASVFGHIETHLPNYTSSGEKTIMNSGVGENNGTTADAGLTVARWYVTAPITSLSVTGAGGNWMQYTKASLYIVTKG